MIRVLEVLASMNRGGVETTLMNIFRSMDREKVMLDFLLTTDKECDYNEEIRKLGGHIYSVPNRKNGLIKNRKALDKFFDEHPEYKIVHMHGASLTYIEPLKAAKRAGVPVRIIHSRNTRQSGSKLHVLLHYFHQFQIANVATHFFACSDLAKDWMYGNKIVSGKCKIINNGIISKEFIFSEEKRSCVRKKLNITSNEFAVVNVGRLADQKNHEFLLAVFNEIVKIVPTAKLFLIGTGPNKVKIEKIIRQYQLDKKVVLLGVRSDINNLLQGMDLFLMPSLYEGLPGSVIEAQGSSLPCLLSDTITKEVAITNLVKYMSLKESSTEWAKSAVEMWYGSSRRDMHEEIVNAGFDMENIAKKMQDFYLKVGKK